ncbi:Protein kinase, putative [Hondaea fermentalgiana]|uniref:Protein kinase, putative n=1 Tax=Hondaea fermentalgiana TaxID=2315210 RepID=A0A2R5GMB0_9STRA|nr:Protein kinase, putative [Hondaea fermentalgiana]|eukprot:GBG32020.1 Protein kinase, putative [Hondaea fermentalgiana]
MASSSPRSSTATASAREGKTAAMPTRSGIDSSSSSSSSNSSGGKSAGAGGGASGTGSDLAFLEKLWSRERKIGVQGLASDDNDENDVEIFTFSQERSVLAKTVWPSSLVLAQAIIPRARRLERELGRKLVCLELGCGLGLVAKVLSALGHEVVATDKENVQVTGTRGGVVNVASFDWSRLEEAPAQVRREFDLIVGADLLYQKASHLALVMALDFCLSISPKASVILAYQVRSPAAEEVFAERLLPSYGMEAEALPLPVPAPVPTGFEGTAAVDGSGDDAFAIEFLSAQHLAFVRLLGVPNVLARDDPQKLKLELKLEDSTIVLLGVSLGRTQSDLFRIAVPPAPEDMPLTLEIPDIPSAISTPRSSGHSSNGNATPDRSTRTLQSRENSARTLSPASSSEGSSNRTLMQASSPNPAASPGPASPDPASPEHSAAAAARSRRSRASSPSGSRRTLSGNERPRPTPRLEISSVEGNRIGNYECLALIGKGSFGMVFLARGPGDEAVAVKVLPKSRLQTRRKQRLVSDEKLVMVQCGHHPFILGLLESFQTKDHICLVSEFCGGGEMFFHLDRAGRFQEAQVRFFCSEIACALVHLHKNRIAYRDLKSENILVDANGHIKLADFGLAAPNVSEWRGARSVCGTPAYIAPEMIRQGGRSGLGYGYCVDWWSLGTLMYDMLVGHPPFYNSSMDTMCENILNRQLTFPSSTHLTLPARDVIRRFLRRKPEQRLGASTAGGFQAVVQHPFFETVDWANLVSNASSAPSMPLLRNPSRACHPRGSPGGERAAAFDIRNFHSDFTEVSVAESLRASASAAPTTNPRRRPPLFVSTNKVDASDKVEATSNQAISPTKQQQQDTAIKEEPNKEVAEKEQKEAKDDDGKPLTTTATPEHAESTPAKADDAKESSPPSPKDQDEKEQQVVPSQDKPSSKKKPVIDDTPRTRERKSIAGVEPAPDAAKYLNLNKARLAESRTVRVFISSTFRDFALERDYLMRHALPELRKFGESRGVTVVFVDLRWGVTSEESSSGAVVRLCLQEIDTCRPFFVGLLGERYGWHLAPPGGYVDELLEQTMDIGEARYPWVYEYRDRSVTELEILHGALRNPEMADFVTFYFRDHEGFKAKMADEIPAADLPAYEAENEHAGRGQARLKQEVKEKFPDRIFDYDHVRTLSQQLVEDVSRAIDAEFPMDKETLHHWDFVDLQHEAFAASRRMGYVAVESALEELNAAADKPGPGLAVVGPSGRGKSALLANWSFRQRGVEKRAVFVHFIGCTTESTDHYHVIRRILAFFGRRFDLDLRDFCQELRTKARDGPNEEVAVGFRPDDALQLKEQQLIEVLPDFLVSVRSKAQESGVQAVIVLDGLDQLEDKAHARTLFWLPVISGISLIASFKSGEDIYTLGAQTTQTTTRSLGSMAAASRCDFESEAATTSRTRRFSDSHTEGVVRDHWFERGGTFSFLPDLKENQREKVIVGYLAEHAKKLDDAQIKMVLDAPPAQNPLFLRTLLDEARLFGNFFKLTEHLEALLKAQTSPELYGIVLERMGAECDADLMRWAIGLVLCARDGITDQELREVLTFDFGPVLRKEGFTDADVAPLSLDFRINDDTKVRQFVQLLFGLREQLCSTSGLLRFFHDAAKEAVRAQLGGLPDKVRQVLHWRLAAHFGAEDVATDNFSRQLRELPYHMLRAERFDDLAAYASRLPVLQAMLQDESKKYELVLYWREVDAAWSARTGTKTPVSVESYLCDVARASKEGLPKEMTKITNVQLEEMRPQLELAADTMDRVSTLLVLLGLYDGAVEIRQDEISYNTVLYGAVHDKIAISCSELADVYERVYCKYDVSMRLKSRAVEIDRQLYGEENRQLAIGYDNLGFLHLKLGNYTDAEAMYRKSLVIKEAMSGKAHRDVAQTVNALGLLNEELGDLDSAQRWYERSLQIRTRAFGPRHPSVARSQIDMGMLMLKKEQNDAALQLVSQGYEALNDTLGLGHSDVAAAANNLGLVYSQHKEYTVALKFHLQAKSSQLRRLGDDHPAFAATCTNIGSVCQELADQAFRKCDESGEDDFFRQAEDHYSRATLIYRVKMGDAHPELATALHNLGTLYFDAASRDVVRLDDLLPAENDKDAVADEEADEALEQAQAKVEELMQQACTNLTEALEIRVKVFGDENGATKSSRESLRICKAKLERFIDSGRRDMALEGEDAGDAGPDLVDLCIGDISHLTPLVRGAFATRLGDAEMEIDNPSPELDAILERIAQDLNVDPFLARDLEAAKAADRLDADAVATVVQTILQTVYAAPA